MADPGDGPAPALPADGHVHSEWSWDAARGSMVETCRRAVDLGLPVVAFTEHLDHDAWTVAVDDLADHPHLARLTSPEGVLTPPPLDVAGYLESVERCRHLFPGLRVLSGVEIGQPHWHPDAVAEVLAAGAFDRVLGSLHCLRGEDGLVAEPSVHFARRPAREVMRDYLSEIVRLVDGADAFAVLAHLDYPVRSWPVAAGPFEPAAYEEELRHALRALAGSGRALEMNTVVPLHATILRWWHDVGGEAVTFGSDAHDPSALGRGFRDARDLAEAHGFRPGRDPHDLWVRA